MVAILIPTKNRSNFLIRQLKYYAAHKSPHPVYIGDSTDREHDLKALETELKTLSKVLRISYLPTPGLSASATRALLVNQVNEDFHCFIGDDDFQTPDSLTQCEKFLTKNPDYSSATGRPFLFGIREKGVWGTLDNLEFYTQRENQENTASERIVNFFGSYYDLLNCVARTSVRKESIIEGAALMDQAFAVELIPNSITVLRGKTKILDCVGFIRQSGHGLHYRMPEPMNWFYRDEFNSGYRKYFEMTVEVLMEQDQLDEKTAFATMESALARYFIGVMNKYYIRKCVPPMTTRDKLKKRLPVIPWLTQNFRHSVSKHKDYPKEMTRWLNQFPNLANLIDYVKEPHVENQ